MADEVELVVRAQAGDRDAFGELYARFHPYVYRCARSWLQDEDPAVAEDVAGNTFLCALRDIKRYEARANASFKSWLLRIARHRMADERRARARHRRFLAGMIRYSPTVPGPDELALSELELEAVVDQLATLPDLERAALALRCGSDMPEERIAKHLDTTPRRVHHLVNTARQNIRLLLYGEADGEGRAVGRRRPDRRARTMELFDRGLGPADAALALGIALTTARFWYRAWKAARGLGVPRVDRQALESRRMRAAALFASGRGPREVARDLGVSQTNAGVWYRAWKAGGRSALRTKVGSVRRERARLSRLVDGPQAAAHETMDGRFHDRVRELLASPTGRTPTSEEIAAVLGIDLASARRIRAEVLGATRAPAGDRVLVVLTLLGAALAGPVPTARILAVLDDLGQRAVYRALDRLSSCGVVERPARGRWRINPDGASARHLGVAS